MTAITDDPLQAWLRLWNGRLDLFEDTVHPDFQSVVPGYDDFDKAALFTVINTVRTRFDVFSVTADLGPIRDGDLTAGRWTAVGVAAGEASYWAGHSIFRVLDDRIVRHWEISTQLQGEPFPLPGTQMHSGPRRSAPPRRRPGKEPPAPRLPRP